MSCACKNDMKNLGNFHQTTWKSQNWDLDGILLSKVENVWAYKTYRGVITTKNDTKIEEEFTCQFKTDIRNL